MPSTKSSRRRSRLRPSIDTPPASSIHDQCCRSLYPEEHSSCQPFVFQALQVSCPIDGDKFHGDDSIALLPCGHIFHRECILPFLSKAGYCPLDGTAASEKDVFIFPFRKSRSRRQFMYKPPVVENITTSTDEEELRDFPMKSWIPPSGDEKCPIDGEPFLPGESVIKCSCGHVFHKNALTPYFNRLNEPTCPIDGKRAWNVETLLVEPVERPDANAKKSLDATEGRGGGKVQVYKLPERRSLKNLFSAITNSNHQEEAPKHPLTLVKEPFEEEKRGKLYDRRRRRSLPRSLPHPETSSSGNLVEVPKKGGRRLYGKNSKRAVRKFARVSSMDELSSLGSYHRYNDSFKEENERVFNRKLRRALINLGRMVSKGEELYHLERLRSSTLERLACVHERKLSVIRRRIALGDRDVTLKAVDNCCVCDGRRLRLEEPAVCILECGCLFHPQCYEEANSCGCRVEKDEERNIQCGTSFELLVHVAAVEELRLRCHELEIFNRERKVILHLDATGNLKQGVTLAESATREVRSSLRSRQAI